MLHHLSTSLTSSFIDMINTILRNLRKQYLRRWGDLVVAHWAGHNWSEGKVDSINGPRAKIVVDRQLIAERSRSCRYLPDAKGWRVGHDEGPRLRYHQEINRLERAQVTMVSPGVITVKYVFDHDYGWVVT